MRMRYFFLSAALFTAGANAGDSTVDAAIGGGIGGAAGAAVGNEVGGRNGAIMGGALGGAVGAALTTDSGHRHDPPSPQYKHNYVPSRGFCPPGQAKKGSC
jgi:hypothetical protein